MRVRASGLRRALTPYSRSLVRLLDDAQRRRQASRRQPAKEDGMITLCIRYTLDAARLADFEAYARS
jgi:hypothetical protein